MKERPVPFSAAMVLALLEDRKTRTRRVVAPRHLALARTEDTSPMLPACPYGVRGDRLWVREAIQFDVKWNSSPPRDVPPGSAVWYPASCTAANAPRSGAFLIGKRRPPMFMPRWCSRITLEVTGVRVERLNSISLEDIYAEGAVERPRDGLSSICDFGFEHREFSKLWDSLNAKRAPWASNPWVWVVEFRRAEAAARAA